MSQQSAFAMMGLMLLISSPALGQAPSSVEQGVTPMDRIDMANPQSGHTVFSAPTKPEERSPFIHDSKFSAQLRSFYLDRKKYDGSYSEAWALGGSLTYQSGFIADVLRVGAVAYTSQPLYAPDGRDGTLLLKPGQDGYTVLGQVYGEVKLSDQIFAALGRKEYNTPYINTNDVRMTPNTFEGISAYGKAGGKDGAPEWRFGGGYISKIKERNSDKFVWMSRDAGANVDRGVYLAGANYDGKDFSIGAINYYSEDIINIFYTEGGYTLALDDAKKLKFAAQYTDQGSTGENLLMGRLFSTRQWGIKGDLTLGATLLSLGYTDTAQGDDMQNPWGGYPGYTSVQVQDFNRAGESAVIMKAAYDFSRHGADGLSAYALWVHGAGVNSPAFNEDEIDLNLQWAPKTGSLRGTSVRVRYAHIKQRGGGDPAIKDFRIIVNHDF
jgi:hypothetical protein